MFSSILLAAALTAAPSVEQPLAETPLTQWLIRCDAEVSASTETLPRLEAAAVDAALTSGKAPEPWRVITLPEAVMAAEHTCWLVTRLEHASVPRAVWFGPTQAAFTVHLDGNQVWLRGREKPYWRSDQGFAGFAIPAPLLAESAPRVLVVRAFNPFGTLRMPRPVVIDPSSMPERQQAEGGGALSLTHAVSVLLWAIALCALLVAGLRRSVEILYFALGTMGFASLIHGMSVAWTQVDNSIITRLSLPSLFVAMAGYGLFFQSAYRAPHRRRVELAVAAELVLVVAITASVPTHRLTTDAVWTVLLGLSWFVYSIYLNVRAFRARDAMAQTVIFGFGAMIAMVGVDAVRYLSVGELYTPAFPLGVLAFSCSILVALGQQFTRLSRESKALLSQLQEAGSSVNAIVVSLQAASTQLSSAAAEQVTALTETASTTTEMNQTSAVSANRCVELIGKGEAASTVVETGKAAADTSLGAIQAISSSLSSVSSASRELAEKVQRIDRIIDTVSFLADQSAALAINASIEASRAGEAGQGFAAVAREVRSLANDSRRATAEVRDVLDEIRTRTVQMESQVAQGGQTVVDGVREVTRLAEVVVTLGGTIQNAVGLMRQVESSARQHQVGVEQVLQAVTNIQRASESIRDGAESLTTLSRQANTLSAGLGASVAGAAAKPTAKTAQA